MTETNGRPMPALSASDIERTQSKVDRSGGPDSCWLWTGGTRSGYGQIGIGSAKTQVKIYAHRLAYFLEYGVDPGALFVCHSCDQRLCCNPKHLWLGTQKQNLEDAAAKGRMHRGEEHGLRKHPELVRRGEQCSWSKLKNADVIEIRALHADGMSRSDLSRKFGVSQRTIGKIARRERWKHVP